MVYVFNLRHEFEEEPKFADFNGFLHDVYAIEVIENNRLKYEEVTVWMLIDPFEYLAKVCKVPSVHLCIRIAWVIEECLHPLKGSFVERLQNVQRSKEKCSRTTSGVEDRNFFNGFVECIEQLWF